MRAIWRGWLSFGLINIPINLYSAIKEKELKFHFLHAKDRGSIRFARICKKDGKEIPWEDIVKGYALNKGDYVVLSDEDFEKASREKTKMINVLDFVEENEIDPIYFERPFFLEPQKGASKAYVVLREALKKTKKVAIAKFVLKTKEHLAAIKPYNDLLILNQLRFADEIRDSHLLAIPKKEKTAAKELEMAVQLIDKLSEHFHPNRYKDTYKEEMIKIIRQRARGRRKKSVKDSRSRRKKTVNLMQGLKASLKKQKRKLAA